MLPFVLGVCSAGIGQTPIPKLEFDVVAIKATAAETGHFRMPASSKGGPGTTDPTLFHCTNCDLSFLISKAFELQRYQFPGQASLPDTVYDLTARVPENATAPQFAEMLQNLLKDRFGLAYHYEKKQVQGYDLTIAKNGPNLKESSDAPKTGGAESDGAGRGWRAFGDGGGHDHAGTGVRIFGGRGQYKRDHTTNGDNAVMVANQLARPVDDRTGLKGKYDVALTWADDGSHSTNHGDAGGSGGDHAGHGGETRGGTAAPADGVSGPTLVEALPAQLGLKLEAKKVPANIFVIDHVEKSPVAR